MSNIEEKKRAVKKRPGHERTVKKRKKELPPLTAGQKFKECIRSIIFCTSLGTFAFAATGLLVIFAGYYTSQKEYSDINDKVVIGTEEAGKEETQPQTEPAEPETDENGEIKIIETQPAGHYIPIQVDDEYYRAVNSDYAMYIYVPGTEVQYPVVSGRADGHYLRYTFKGTENMAGAILIDHPVDTRRNGKDIRPCAPHPGIGRIENRLVKLLPGHAPGRRIFQMVRRQSGIMEIIWLGPPERLHQPRLIEGPFAKIISPRIAGHNPVKPARACLMKHQ